MFFKKAERIDPHQEAKVRHVARYKTGALPFAMWLVRQGLHPNSAEQWDDLLADWQLVVSGSVYF